MITRQIEIRPGDRAMLTFPAANDPGLDALYEALVALLLEQLAPDAGPQQENRNYDHPD
jgi:hypothetical protein